jgi:hypothetical protein
VVRLQRLANLDLPALGRVLARFSAVVPHQRLVDLRTLLAKAVLLV